MQKAGLALCALAIAFAPVREAAAGPRGLTIEVKRVTAGGPGAAWTMPVPPHVVDAIERAAIATGADYGFLLRTAALESSFDPRLEAKTSSAVGLYQFIDRTWLLMVQAHGMEAGLETLAAAVALSDKGEFEVEDAALKEEILALRNDVKLAALMAGVFARQNAVLMARTLGRAPEPAELYIGHLLGAAGGVQLIKLAETRPKDRADKPFHRAARANKALFFDGRRPLSLREVRDLIAAKYDAITVRTADEALQAAELPAAVRSTEGSFRLASD